MRVRSVGVRRWALLATLAAGLVAARSAGAGDDAAPAPTPAAVLGTPVQLIVPANVEPPPIPSDNPLTREKIVLGEKLFFEKELSGDRTLACATCHDPRLGFADGRPTARGIHGQLGMRNSPSLLNVAYVPELFLDGRAGSLEEQAAGPIFNPTEMGMPEIADVESRLTGMQVYGPLFQAAFGDPRPIPGNVVRALASFERTLVALTSPVDRFLQGDKTALSPEAARGFTIFRRRGNCSSCHFIDSHLPVFSEMTFKNLGVGFVGSAFALATAQADRIDQAKKDSHEKWVALKKEPASSILGRYLTTGERKDIGRFRTPALRNVSRTAPYMHDGSLPTLRAVVDFYDKGGEENPNRHFSIHPLRLNEQQKNDLVAFMEALDADPSPNFDLEALKKRADEVLGPL